MRNYNDCTLFFDTNILLDALQPTRPQCTEARSVLNRCNGGGDIGFACSTSFKDAYYILSKMCSERQAREAVQKLMGLLVVAPIGSEECFLSAESDEPDFEDGLIRACAELNHADFILTRDVAAFKNSPIRAVTCAEYLRIAASRDARFLAAELTPEEESS